MDRRSLGRGARVGDAGRTEAPRPGPGPPPRVGARRPPARLPPTAPYRADAFALALPPGWADATVYTVAGPVADGLPHAVTVSTVAHDGRSVQALADEQVAAVRETLAGGAVLLRDTVALASGAAAERAVVRWSPVPGQVRYQQLVVAVVSGRTVVMAATFTARSRRVLGPEVHRIMLSLAEPGSPGRPGLAPRLGR